jgi:hypothetical protein
MARAETAPGSIHEAWLGREGRKAALPLYRMAAAHQVLRSTC